MGIEMVDFKHMVYVQERAQYEPADEIRDKENVTILNISGTELRRRWPKVWKSQNGSRSPKWSGIAPHPSAAPKQGFTVFFTGFLWLGQIHHRQCAYGQADGNGRPPCDAAGW